MTDLLNTDTPQKSGDLIYVMGASGAGKDSLLNYARRELLSHERLAFAHRYITRPIELNGENHIALAEEEFEQRQLAGCFAMTWQAHDKYYGIGVEIDLWLDKGITVVVNGSRAYLAHAMGKYPNMKPVLISASKEKIRERLINRGRENTEEIQHRLKRVCQFRYGADESDPIVVIDNNGSIAEAGQQLSHYLQCPRT